MNNITQHYIIDLSSNNNYVQVPVMQGDGNDTRIIEIELQQNGVPYEIDAQTNMVTIMGTKPDGTEIWDTCTIDANGYIIVNITYQMATVVGRSVYTIAIFEVAQNRCLKSFPFFVMVTRASFDPNYIMSSDEFQTLVEIIGEAERSEEAAAASATKAESYAVGGTGSRQGEDTDNSKFYYEKSTINAATSTTQATKATNAATTATGAANTATTQATNATNSASAAAASESVAVTMAADADASATTATTAATNAAASETAATTAAANALTYSTNAATSARAANTSAISAATSATNANTSAGHADDCAVDALASKNAAAVSEANAAQYAADAQAAAQGIGGGLIPMGTVLFADLPSITISTPATGAMYEVSDAFTTTSDFEVGAGVSVPAGSAVYLTNNRKWAIKTPTIVQGVKGDAEANYRQGNINITAADIGVQRIFYVNAEPTGNAGDIWIG